MQRVFIIISVLCLLVAAFYLWRGNLDATFIVAIIGIVAFFLNIRSNFKATIQENEENNSKDLQEDEN